MALTEAVHKVMDRIRLAHKTYQCWNTAVTEMNHRVPYSAKMCFINP